MKECPRCRACADESLEHCPNDGSALDTTIPGPCLLDGKYQLQRRLGEGGMGVVYRGRHVDLRRDVAIKVIGQAVEGFADRFRIEAAALGRLKHPHIVDVMDFGVEDARGIAYLVMELLEGVTLDARCKAGLPARSETLEILEQIADGVDFAHAHGILHRDLKPANVFLVHSSSGADTVKIVDFGLAQFLHPDGYEARSRPSEIAMRSAPPNRISADSATTTIVDRSGAGSPDDTPSDLMHLQERDRGLLMGTQAYMAPELFRLEPATPAVDIFALGVVAYELLTGSLPAGIPGAGEQIDAPSTLGGTPPELDAPVMRLLEADQARRPVSARAAVAAIAVADRAARIREWRKRELPRRGLAACALGLLAGLGGSLWRAPPIARLERSTIDARFAIAAPRAPNPAILLIALDDRSVDADVRPLALRGDEIASGLGRVFDAGARAIAIDLLLPQVWAHSGPFAELIVRHADRLTLAALSNDAGSVIGPECLPPLVPAFLGPERTRAIFGFVNLDSGTDGVTRQVGGQYRDAEGRLQPTWSARAAATAGASLAADRDRDTIDYTIDHTQFSRVPWQDVVRLADTKPETFRDRLVLVGGEFTGSGDERAPMPGRSNRGKTVSGLVVQATVVNTILDGFPIREARHWPAAAGTAIASSVLTFLILMRRRVVPAFALAAALGVAWVVAALSVFAAERILWPVAGPILFLILASGAAFLIRVWLGDLPEGT